MTKLTQTCFWHIRDLRRIRPSLSLETAKTIGAALVHSKIDYCNSLFVNLPSCEINRLQFIQNSLARAIYRSPKFCHITPLLESLHWLRVPERIVYKILSLAYKVITTSEPSYLADLITVQPLGQTRSSDVITLSWPSTISHYSVSHRAFEYAAPQLWNSLPSDLSVSELRKRHPDFPDLPALSPDKFHKELKKYLFEISYPTT